MHIVINGKEVINPVVKVGIAVSAMLIAALTIAGVLFILLPLIGITMAFTLGLVVIIFLGSLLGSIVLVMIATLFGPIELCFKKMQRRKR